MGHYGSCEYVFSTIFKSSITEQFLIFFICKYRCFQALTSIAFYFLQDYKDGRILWFNVKGWLSRCKNAVNGCCKRQDENDADNEEDEAKILMDYEEAMSSFILGMEKIFGALVVLTLAWASGAIMQSGECLLSLLYFHVFFL